MATKGVKIGVRGLRARNTQYITLRSIKPHAPGVSPVSERVQVSLKGYLVVPASNVTVEQAVIRNETDLGGDYLGQVVYVQKKETCRILNNNTQWCPILLRKCSGIKIVPIILCYYNRIISEVECLYNTVQYYVLFHKALQWPGENIFNSQKT